MMIKLEYMYESLPFAYVHELQILYAIPIQHTKHSVSGMEHSPNYKVLCWTALHFSYSFLDFCTGPFCNAPSHQMNGYFIIDK